MSEQHVEVTSDGIKRVLKKFSVEQAIAEYIWNGFDANATQVKIDFQITELGGISKITILDNGDGIPYAELGSKFVPFLHSQKAIIPRAGDDSQLTKGKNGVGRLTFFHFAEIAIWETTYTKKNSKSHYSIKIASDVLEKYVSTIEKKTTQSKGTKVSFERVTSLTQEHIIGIKEYITKEFSWFLKLNEDKHYEITINDTPINYRKHIHSSKSIVHNIDKHNFEIELIIWDSKLNKESSKAYYFTPEKKLTKKETTSFNNKSDGFYHSVYVESPFFSTAPSQKNNDNNRLFDEENEATTVYRKLKTKIDDILIDARRDFINQKTEAILNRFEDEGVFPHFNADNDLDSFRHDKLKRIIGGLYQVEPKLFNSISTVHKKTLVRLIDHVSAGQGLDTLFTILEEVLNLNEEQRRDLVELLKVTSLSSIIKTIKMVKDRFAALEHLDTLLFTDEPNANEVQHIQSFVENHYWIFGEQYMLVTAAEPSFEEGLRRHLYLLRGEKKKKGHVRIDHESRKRAPDIFMMRNQFHQGKRKCIIVELKHRKIKLGNKELRQVLDYMDVICSEPRYNGDDIIWEFHLVGNQMHPNQRDIIDGQKSCELSGEKFLTRVSAQFNYKVYAYEWSNLRVALEEKLKFLQDQLELQRKLLAPCPSASADEIVASAQNSAKCPPQVSIPS
ncbi:ATP-binding protein [Oleidesulfovibrio alaskensis]|uniref:ATP-binding protein n=1 Tax=Oleidesulfovibrio alaskensis TaxID=58180 RepID=UPI00138AF6E9|nr:ATP-binding protein [Oleidesulfovibrio alaskensis]